MPRVPFAGTYTLSQTYTIPADQPPYTVDFQLNGFDTSLGTLTGVELKLNTSTTATLDVINPLATTQSFAGAYVSVPMKVTGPGGASVQAADDAGPASGTVAAARLISLGLRIRPPQEVTINGKTTFDGLAGSASATTQVANADFGLRGSVGFAFL